MKPHREFADPRGVPVVGRGRRSTMPGSDPLAAVLAKEARGRLQIHAPDPIQAPQPATPHVRRRLGKRVMNQRHL